MGQAAETGRTGLVLNPYNRDGDVPERPQSSIILDNYGIHDSQQVQLSLKSAAANRIQLHFLPP